MRHQRLVDPGQRLGELGEVLLGQPELRPAIGIDRELGRLRAGRADRQRAIGLALAFQSRLFADGSCRDLACLGILLRTGQRGRALILVDADLDQ